MAIKSDDLGADVQSLGSDLSATLRQLEGELRKVQRQAEKIAAKGKELPADLAKRKTEVEALYAGAREKLISNAGKQLLTPQASAEVRREAEKVIKGELGKAQQTLARNILSGKQGTPGQVQEIGRLQTLLAATEAREGGNGSQYYRAMRQRFGGSGSGLLASGTEAFSMRGRIRHALKLGGEISSGELRLNAGTLMDAKDTAELGVAGVSAAGQGLRYAGAATGSLGLMRVGSGLRAAAANGISGLLATTAGAAAGGVGITLGTRLLLQKYINAGTREIGETYGSAMKESADAFGSSTARNRVMQLREIVTGQKSPLIQNTGPAYKEVGKLARQFGKWNSMPGLLQAAMNSENRAIFELPREEYKRFRNASTARERTDALINAGLKDKKIFDEIESVFSGFDKRNKRQAEIDRDIELNDPQQHYKNKYTDLTLHLYEKERMESRGAVASI